MAHTLQIVDPDDLTTILLDLADSTGVNNSSFGSVKTELKTTWQLSVPTGNPLFFEPPASPGGFLAYSQDELVTSSLNVRLEGASTDALYQFVGELQRHLRAGCVIKWIPEGYTDIFYIDVAYGYAEGLQRAQELADQNLLDQSHIVREGIGITIYRQPYLRGPELDSDTNKLKNAGLFWVGATANRPGNWAWSSTTNISSEAIATTGAGPLPNWTGAFYQFAIATTSARSLQQTTEASSFASGDIVTMSFYVKASAGSILQARAAVQFKQADGTTNVGSEHVGTLTAIGTGWTRVSVTTTAAGANTSRALVSIRFESASASSVTASIAAAQAEVGSTPRKFVFGTETVYNDPASTSGYGRVFPLYLHGAAPAPLLLESTFHTNSFAALRLGLRDRGDLASYLNTGELVQAESFIPAKDTTATASGASYSGAGSNTLSTSFATQTVLTPDARATFSTTSVYPAAFKDGVWDVYVRIAATTSEFIGTIQLKWGLAPGVVAVTENETTVNALPVATSRRVKVGRIAAPALNVEGLYLELFASRTSGTGVLLWDFVEFVPSDSALLEASITSPALASGETLVVNAEERSAYVLEGALYQRPWSIAGPPGLHPPAGLSVVHAEYAQSESIAQIATLSHRYRPRYYG